MKTLNLVVVAHPDDEILGFGATGAKLVDSGEVVQPIVLCGAVNSREAKPDDKDLLSDIQAANNEVGFCMPVLGDFPNIRMNTVDHIDLVKFIEKQIVEFEPTRIFTHHSNDLNNDHLQVSLACAAASRLPQRRPDVRPIDSLYCMEILSSTDWSYGVGVEMFCPNTFFEVGNYVDKKITALKHYRGVMRPYPHSRSDETIRSLAALRGSQAGVSYAESFQCVFNRKL